MKIKITQKDINNAIALQDQVNTDILQYLTKLQEREASIICVDDDIASGNWGCYHYSPRPLFHWSPDYKPYIKKELKYKIESYEKDGTMVDVDGLKLLVPYMFNESDFENECTKLFANAKKDMERCFRVKKEEIKKWEKEQKIDKHIVTPHKFKDYTYYWRECKKCQCGYVYVGTGKFEDDPWSYADAPREREITRRETCPICHGTQGLLIYSNNDNCNGNEKQKPCSKWAFIRHENDFMKLLADI
jgi:hypothetical protein